MTQWTLEIRRPDKAPRHFTIADGIYPIGSDPDNSIILPDPSVSWRHAVLSLQPGEIHVEDLMTQSGTQVSGRPVKGRHRVQPGEPIQVGCYTLIITDGRTVPAPASGALAVAPSPSSPPPGGAAASSAAAASPMPSVADRGPAAGRAEEERRRSVRRQIHQELIKRLDIKRLAANRVEERDLKTKAREVIRQIIEEVRDRLPPDIKPDQLLKEVYDEAVGLGPLEDLLADPEVTEIMVNGPDQVYIERAGKLYLTGKTFLDDDSVLAIIERIVSPIGRRIDESQPYVDARLPDGSRVNAIIAPLSLSGPCLTIRKFSKNPFTVEDLVRFETWTPWMAEFLRACVLLKKNMVISGGTGSGKTTLLNVLSGFLPPDERIITIEDAAELRLSQPHVIRLEARPPNIEGRGAVTVRDLVRNALRMRPDRIVVGECRGGEALDMLQAMNTGHEGSLTTIHANSPRDALSRLETMVLMAGMDLPLRAIREQIASAIHLVIHVSRYSDGSRKINRISEVVGLEGDQITMQDIFVFEQTGLAPDGRVLGAFRPTGSVPTFVEEAGVRGVRIDHAIFDPARVS